MLLLFRMWLWLPLGLCPQLWWHWSFLMLLGCWILLLRLNTHSTVNTLLASFQNCNNWNYPYCYYRSERCSRFVYSCSHCEQLYLDIDCATMSCVIDPQANQQRFIRWMRPISFTCNTCSENESDKAHFCTMCQIKVHKSCISLPYTIT